MALLASDWLPYSFFHLSKPLIYNSCKTYVKNLETMHCWYRCQMVVLVMEQCSCALLADGTVLGNIEHVFELSNCLNQHMYTVIILPKLPSLSYWHFVLLTHVDGLLTKSTILTMKWQHYSTYVQCCFNCEIICFNCVNLFVEHMKI